MKSGDIRKMRWFSSLAPTIIVLISKFSNETWQVWCNGELMVFSEHGIKFDYVPLT